MGTGKNASGSRAKLIKTVISAVLVVAMIAMIAAANYFIPSNSSTVESVLGIASKGIDNSNAKTTPSPAMPHRKIWPLTRKSWTGRSPARAWCC